VGEEEEALLEGVEGADRLLRGARDGPHGLMPAPRAEGGKPEPKGSKLWHPLPPPAQERGGLHLEVVFVGGNLGSDLSFCCGADAGPAGGGRKKKEEISKSTPIQPLGTRGGLFGHTGENKEKN